MVRLVDELVASRSRFLTDFGHLLAATADALCGDAVQVVYTPSMEGPPERLMSLFRMSRERDLAVGATLSGPHRDAVDLLRNRRTARTTASLGQARLLSIACRLAQARWFDRQFREPPLILLDDVTAELDRNNRDRFRSFYASGFGGFQTLEALPADAVGSLPASANTLVLGGSAP